MNSQTITSIVVLSIMILLILFFLPLTTGVAYITFWKGRDNTNRSVYKGGYKK